MCKDFISGTREQSLVSMTTFLFDELLQPYSEAL